MSTQETASQYYKMQALVPRSHTENGSRFQNGVSIRALQTAATDPLYIEKRYQWYQANAAHIAYEAYFNESAAYYAGSIVPVVGAPNSAAQYKELW